MHFKQRKLNRMLGVQPQSAIVLQHQKGRTAREVGEAFFIDSLGNQTCISLPSLFLHSNEHAFLQKWQS